MAARSDAATDRVSRSTAPSLASFTICAWAKVVNSAAPLFHPITRFSDAGDSSSWIVGFKGTNGRTPSCYSPGNATGISGAEVALGTWVFVAATLSGTAAAIHTGTSPGSLTKVTGTVAAANTPTQFGVFGRSAADGSEWLDGSLAGLRMWTAVLSDAEIVSESQSIAAVRTSGLWGSWPFASAALTDASGNSRNLTAGSTALSSDTDPTLTTDITGTGALTAPAAVASGTGTATVAGTGAATAPKVIVAGTGADLVTGSGAAAAPSAQAAGAGTVAVAGSGALTAPPAVTAGIGAVMVAGTGALIAPPASASGAGTVVVAGTGALVAPPAVVAGAGGGTAAVEGSSALVAPAARAAGAGQVVVTGVGVCVAPAAVVHGFDQQAQPAGRPRLTLQPNRAAAELAGSTTTAVLTPNTASLEGAAP